MGNGQSFGHDPGSTKRGGGERKTIVVIEKKGTIKEANTGKEHTILVREKSKKNFRG